MTIELNVLNIAIALIILIQTFGAGYTFADTKTNNAIDIIFCLAICLFGIPIVLVYLIYDRIIKPLFNVFALQDFYSIYFQKSLHNLNEDQIKMMNDMYTRYLHMTTRKLKRFFKLRTLSKIAKINNFKLIDGKATVA